MTKAFVDTTILTDCLLKPSSDKGKAAKAALRNFSETELPVYAIKEFKAGPLHGYIWLHNVFVTEDNFQRTLFRLHALSTSKNRNLALTAQEALAEASGYFSSFTSTQLMDEYGKKANADSMQVDTYRLRLKELVLRGWGKRRRLTTRVVVPISCYQEVSPTENAKGMITYEMYQCEPGRECSLAKELKANISDLRKLRKAVSKMPASAEQARRHNALDVIVSMPGRKVTEQMCRALGDAIFAFFAPMDSVILTTNTKDHEPLAASLGKKVERPEI
jgi:hypothetical protein